MARKSKEAAEKKIQFARLKSIWTDLTFGDWILLVSDLCPEAGFTRSGPHIKGRCPFHDDPGPSFVITPGKGMVKCFAAMPGGIDEDPQISLCLFLADILVQRTGAQRALHVAFVIGCYRFDHSGHRYFISLFRASLRTASMGASAPGSISARVFMTTASL